MKHNQFIILHDAQENFPTLVNVNNIGNIEYTEYINKKNNKPQKKTIIFFIVPLVFKNEKYYSMMVNETVENIYEQIYKEK